MGNPYNATAQPINTTEFLSLTYKMMLKKIERLIEIENSKKRGKLPLPLLKEKLETTSKVLEAIHLIADSFDYDKDIAELLDIFNDFGIILGEANMSDDHGIIIGKLNICKIILEGFLDI